MKVVVTGGAGFIGSTLAGALLVAGHEVHVLDDLSRGKREQVPGDADFHVVDVADDQEIPRLIASIRPEMVFHEAAQIDVRRSVSDPLVDARINVLGTINMLEACARNDVRRFVFASSGGAIYGDSDILPTPEPHNCAPASGYGAAKLAGEAYGGVFEQVHGLEFVALRYGNVYGPRQDPHGEAGVVAIFIERLLAGNEVVINGDGTQTRDYVHVDDVVAANLRAAQTDSLGAYNVGTARECDVNALYQVIATTCGVHRPAQHGPAKPGEQRRSCLDISHARDVLAWQPAVSLEDGIAGTVEWFRQGGT